MYVFLIVLLPFVLRCCAGCTREKPAVIRYKELTGGASADAGNIEAAVTEQPSK